MMKRIQIYQVDAFTDTPLLGNPAGVVPRADGMEEWMMQKIAREMNVSETVFVFHKEPPHGCAYRIRFFTPTVEVDYCGHGTIAAAHLLRELEVLSKTAQPFRQAMNRETWEILFEEDLIWIRQGPGEVRTSKVDRSELAQLLGLDLSALKEPFWASTGNPVLLCEISDGMTLDNLMPDWNGLAQFTQRHDVIGLHCFAIDPHDPKNHLSARVFAPSHGIHEDPATGSTTSSLALYLFSEGRMSSRDGVLRIEQGVSMGRPSLLFARLGRATGNLTVEVGGNAVTVLSGEIQL